MITCKLCSAFYTCDVSDSRNHPFSCKLCHVVNFVSTGYIQNLHCDRSVQHLTYNLSLKQPNKVYISEFTCVYDYKTNKNPLKRHGNNMSWNISNAIFKMWMFTKLQLDNSNNQPNLNVSDGVINKIQSSNSAYWKLNRKYTHLNKAWSVLNYICS